MSPRKLSSRKLSLQKTTSKEQVASSPNLIQDSQEFIEENLEGAVLDWLKDQPLYKDGSSSDKKTQENVFKDLVVGLMSVVEQNHEDDNMDPILLEEIKKHVEKLPMNSKLKSDEKFVNELPGQILSHIKGLKLFHDISQREQQHANGSMGNIGKNLQFTELSNKFVIEAVEQWVKTLVLPKLDDGVLDEIVTNAKSDAVNTLSNKFIYTDEVPFKNFSDIFHEVVNIFIEKIPQHTYKSEDINILSKSLQDTFREFSKKYPMLTPTKIVKKRAALVLLEDIAEWIQNLPIESKTKEEQLESEKAKLQFESKLIHKIGEMNMNHEVFHDDFIYEDTLEDEIDHLLGNISSRNVQNNLPKLKKDLMTIILKARLNIRKENTNQIYIEQLHETIGNTMPTTGLSEEGLSSLEVLKDDVADAFINMCYVGNDKNKIDKLKKEISEKIFQFCNAYLKQCPASPLSTFKLNVALFNALNSITVPQNDSFKDEVEIVKLKLEINEWVKNLPLKDQDAHDKLQINKMVCALAKKLHDIENEKVVLSELESNEKLKKEIFKFLAKLPLQTGSDELVSDLVETFIKNLNNTEKSRKSDASAEICSSCAATKRKPKLNITFKNPCPGTIKDCNLGVCLETHRCPDKKSSSFQTICSKLISTECQTQIDEECQKTCDRDTDKESGFQQPLASCPNSIDTSESYTQTICQPQHQCNVPIQENQCTKPSLQSCLITRPCPLQPREAPMNNQHQLCESCQSDYDEDDYYCELPRQPAPFRPESCESESTAMETQFWPNPCMSHTFCSKPHKRSQMIPNQFTTSTPYTSSDLNNVISQRRSSGHVQAPQSMDLTQPFHLSTASRASTAEQNNNCQHLQESCPHCPLAYMPCPTAYRPLGPRRVIESQFIPYPHPGSMQRLIQPSNHQCQDPNWLPACEPVNTCPSRPMSCPPRRPSGIRLVPPIPCEHFSSGQSCPRATFLRSKPRHMDKSCMPRMKKARKQSAHDKRWENGRFHSDEEYNQRQAQSCRCNPTHDEYYVALPYNEAMQPAFWEHFPRATDFYADYWSNTF